MMHLLWVRLEHRLEDQLRPQLENQIALRLDGPVPDFIWWELRHTLWVRLRDRFGNQLRSSLQFKEKPVDFQSQTTHTKNMANNKQQFVSQITCRTLLGSPRVFFSLREVTERKIIFLKECGHVDFHVKVVPASTAGHRKILE